MKKSHREAISKGLIAHHKGKKKYTVSQRRALEHSKTSKTGSKSWRERQKQKKPGLWSNYHAKRHREAR